jgi:hypothetical protein
MTLILWKAPVVDDPDEAAELLRTFDLGDESVFQPSSALATVAEELLRRFPDADDGPWTDGPPESSGRLLVLGIRWHADDAVTDAVAELARQHELVLYDPQGPAVYLPSDPVDPGPVEPPSLRDHLWIVLIGLAAAGVFWLGWWIDVPVLEWILMLVGGFFVTVVLFLLYIFIFEPKEEAR